MERPDERRRYTLKTRVNMAGFSYLDTLLALVLTSIALGSVLAVAIPLKRDADVSGAALRLLWQLRVVQSLASTTNHAANVWLDPYDTGYHLTYGTTWIGQYRYPPDVDYVDGYLLLPNHIISYDNLGDAQVAGEIRLTNGASERDVNVYMGVGLQAAGWITE